MPVRTLTTRRPIAVAVAVVATVVVAACGSSDPQVSAGRARPIQVDTTPQPTDAPATTEASAPTAPPVTDEPPATEAPETTTGAPVTAPADPKGGATIDFGSGKQARDYDGYLVKAIADIQAFWRTTFPKVFGKPYTDLQHGIYAVYPGRQGVPGCGSAQTTFTDVKDNAFYCFVGDFVAYDDQDLLPSLHSDLGDAVIGLVFAHEWGHAIQQRAGVDTQHVPTITAEQQADCYAGAWIAHLSRGENPALKFTDNDLKKALVGMIAVRDHPGAVSTDPAAHGSAFDRVGALQDGFLHGAEKCATYIESPPPTILLPFSQQELATRGDRAGDAPFEDQPPSTDATAEKGIFQLIQQSLEVFWPFQLDKTGTAFTPPTAEAVDDVSRADCNKVPSDAETLGAFYCKQNNEVFYDGPLARDQYDRIGDFAPAIIVAIAWSEAVQEAQDSGLTAEDRALQNDCLAGAWTHDVIPGQAEEPDGEQQTQLSPGDLDEAVQSLIDRADEHTDDNVVGSPFERVDAFRTGVLNGLPGCQARLQ
jgi:predicted metalloprotease